MPQHTVLDHVLIGLLVVGLLYAVLFGQKKLKGTTMDTATKLSVYWSNGVLLWIVAAVVCVVWRVGGRPLETLGLTWQQASPGIGTGIAIGVAFVVWMAIEFWHDASSERRRAELLAKWRRDVALVPETTRELAHFSFLGATAGVTEEIIFRGFAISYLSVFTGTSTVGISIAIAIPAIAFGISHLYQGGKAVIRIVIMAVAFGAMFHLTRSLLIPIILHALVDIFAGTFAVLIARENDAQGPPAELAGPRLDDP